MHGLALGGVDLDHGAGRGSGNLGVDLVGGDLDDRLVFRDGIALLLVPFQDGALGDRVAHRRHDDLDRGVDCHLGVSGYLFRSCPGRPCPLPDAAFLQMKPRLPANGPTPPTTATITPSQGGITRRLTAARQSSDMTIQPHAVHPPEHGHEVLAARDRRPQQHGVDDRVRVGAVAQDGPAQDRAHASSDAIRRSAGSASPPASRRDPRGHHACASCSASRRDLGAVGQPGQADEHRQPVGQADERLDGQALGRDRPLLLELARQRLRPGPRRPRPRRRRRAPSARPTSRPTARAARPASGRRRRASRTAPRASTTRRRAPAAATSASAAAPALAARRRRGSRRAVRRSRRGRRAAVASAAIAASAASRPAAAGRRLLAPAAGDLAGLPGSAGEDAGGR